MLSQRISDSPTRAVTAKARVRLLLDERSLVQTITHLEGQLEGHMNRGRTREAMDCRQLIERNKARLAWTQHRLGVAS